MSNHYCKSAWKSVDDSAGGVAFDGLENRWVSAYPTGCVMGFCRMKPP
jgi:hypothetical protein